MLTNDAEPLEICQQSSELPNLPLVVPMQLPNVMSTITAAAKLKAVVTKKTPQSNDAVLPVVDEYLGLKSDAKNFGKDFPVSQSSCIKTKKEKESAENLTSLPFKKRLEELENNVKEKQQAAILHKKKSCT